MNLQNGKEVREMKGMLSVNEAQGAVTTGPSGKKYLNSFMVLS